MITIIIVMVCFGELVSYAELLLARRELLSVSGDIPWGVVCDNRVKGRSA